MEVLIRNARVVDPQSDYNGQVVDINISADGIIKEISPASGKNSSIHEGKKELWSGKDLMVSPGWIDVLADYREPGFEHKETIESGLRAAAAGGFTGVMLAPNTQPAVSSKSSVQYILQKAAGNAVTVYPLGAVTQNTEGKELAEMLDMREHGAVAFSDGWKPVQNANLALKALEYVRAFHGVIVQLPVDAHLSSGGLMHEGPVSTQLGMAGIPALAETLMVHRDIELVRYTHSKLHITGISTVESVAMIRKAKAEGLTITCSVTPYHLALTDESLRTYDSAYKVSPPLRTEADRQALIHGLKDGTIDCIASHHRPQEWDAKAKEFEYASDGMNVQENAFNIVWDAVKNEMSVERLVDALALRPREIFNLTAATVNVGSKPGLTLFSTSGHATLTESNMQSISRNNPFIGKSLPGQIVGIINNKKVHIKN